MSKSERDVLVIPQALSEIIDRLTIEEKREFARLVDLDELARLKAGISGRERKRVPREPEVYVGTTDSGLSFEVPVNKIKGFIKSLLEILEPNRVEWWVQGGGDRGKRSFSLEGFKRFVDSRDSFLLDGYALIEFDDNTLVSGGGGCISLSLRDVEGEIKREIAEEFLRICGFEHKFTGEGFSAIVWKDKLEVLNEKER